MPEKGGFVPPFFIVCNFRSQATNTSMAFFHRQKKIPGYGTTVPGEFNIYGLFLQGPGLGIFGSFVVKVNKVLIQMGVKRHFNGNVQKNQYQKYGRKD